MRQTSFVVSTTNNHNSGNNGNGDHYHHSDSSSSDSMCSTNPASRFSETMLAASIGGTPIGRTLISAMDLKLRCSANGCECANFIAAKDRLRSCDGCTHSWITHLFEKLLRDETLSIFDVCSLALYGTHALPIRLKIVIERLLGTLQPEEIDKILRSFGWTSPDLARGYMIQEPRGGLLTRWSMLPREEEILILQQFLRFAPTRSLSFSLLKDDFQFNITQQQLQLQQQHQVQVQQQLQLPAPPMIPTTTSMIEATTKIKTENSALNLSSVHSRSRSIPATAASISPPTSSAYQQQSLHQHHHGRRRHSHNHNHHHHFNHQLRSHERHGHGDREGERRGSTGGAESSTDEEPSTAGRRDRDRDRSDRDNEPPPSRRRDSEREQEGNGSQPPVDLSFSSNTKHNANSGSPINHTSVGGMTQLMGHGNHKSNSHSYKNNSTLSSSMHGSNNHGSSNINNNNNNIGKLVEEHQHQLQLQQHRLRERHSREREPRTPKDEKSSLDSLKTSPDSHSLMNHRQHHQHWSPLTANPSQLINPATGKRRVQCSVCLKTFCDKGALKIHFSAVHLREMHKCTVAGCNMMFSSRRSRNRHSANPNPKLHSPHLRRRISPHDGRSSNPLIPTPMLCGPGGLMPPFTNGLKMDEDLGHHMDEMDAYLSPSSSSSSLTSEKSPLPEESARPRDGARKRKLSNPVRLPSVPDDSNDDFCCYDDGTEVVPDQEEIREDDEQSPRDVEEMDEDDGGEKNHLERLESLPIFSNHSDERDSHSIAGDADGMDRDDDLESTGSPNSGGSDSIPIDKENPRRCITCGKEFQNHFGVKTHYQNVHLKVIDPLMHKCTVDGCNAAFPSKRSRDRHAANLNLHRKLLSTSDASNGSDGGEGQSMFTPSGQAQAAMVATTLTQQIQQQQQLFAAAGVPPRHAFNPFLLNGANPGAALNQVTPAWNPFLPFPVFPGVFNAGMTPPGPGSILSPTRLPPMTHATSPSSSVSPPQNIAPATSLPLPSTSPSSSSSPNHGSSSTDCRFCNKSFEQTSALLHHLETVHASENQQQKQQYTCHKCGGSFSSTRKLDSHNCCH